MARAPTSGAPESTGCRARILKADTRSVQGLEIDDFPGERIDASVAELREERDAVAELGLL